jgi:glucose-1-phosphate cytidylyltransferase
MVEIKGNPILWHIMKSYQSFLDCEFIIATGYLSAIIEDYISGSRFINEGIKAKVLFTGADSSTGGRVKQAMAIVKQEEAIQSDMDEAMKKQKAAELLSDIGSGLMASTLVPLIPLAIGHAMNIGFSGGLAVHFATAGLLLSLAEVIRKKQSNTENRNS